MSLKNRFFILFLLFFSFTIKAEILVLNSEGLTQSQKRAAEALLKEASSLLPELVKASIKDPINVSFLPFIDNGVEPDLPKKKCQDPTPIIYGKTNRLGGGIVLNRRLLPEIEKGEEHSSAFDCGHKNYYRQSLATLLHEISHLYDHQQFNTTKVSGQLSFFKLSDWKKSLLLMKSPKNKSQKRSVDPYEFKNLDEHFAVNFEYFLLDPDYQCKRPSYYRYFKDHFKHNPFSGEVCKINSEVRLDDTHALIDISPSRVYRVDYLLASKGDEMISGFGHSMYRLIVCAPFRKTVSAECLKDKLYHVVLSFRANITDIKSNPFKGLIGKYDSILFMLSFPKVIEEYNMAELRDLYSIPLQFTTEQKERFIHKAIETYWEYSGSYKFLSANCASESLELLQAALNNNEIIKESVVKPYSLWEVLYQHKLTNIANITDFDAAKKQGLLFESDAGRLEEIKKDLMGLSEEDFALVKIRRTMPKGPDIVETKKVKKHIKDVLESLKAEAFADVFDQLEKEDVNLATKNKLNDLSILAQAAVNVKQHELDEKIGDYLEEIENDNTNLGQSVRNWNTKRKNFRLLPLKDDYGIPLVISDDDFDTYKRETELLEKTEMDLVNDVKDRYKEDVDVLLGLQKVIGDSRNKSKVIAMKLYLNR